jgi:CHAT domain-containing protein
VAERANVRNKQVLVDSTSTSTLMINFHKHLKGQTGNVGLTTADALRKAVLALMQEPRYRHPFFWAGFVVIGDGN